MPLWSSACPSQATALTASLAFLTRGLLTLRRVPEQAADAIPIPIVNPVSLLATAVRHLMAGTASGTEVGWVLLASAAITAVFAPLTMRLYRVA